jgi:hypothetical protein
MNICDPVRVRYRTAAMTQDLTSPGGSPRPASLVDHSEPSDRVPNLAWLNASLADAYMDTLASDASADMLRESCLRARASPMRWKVRLPAETVRP